MSSSEQGLIQPSTSVALKAFDAGARACAFPFQLGAGGAPLYPFSALVSLNNLPPGMELGQIGSLYVDNSASAFPIQILFPDSGAIFTVAAGAQEYIVAITGLQQFVVTLTQAAVLDNAGIAATGTIQVVNRVIPPTISAGQLVGTNPTGGHMVWANAGVQNLCNAYAGRRIFITQFPSVSGGTISFDTVGSTQLDQFSCVAGEKVFIAGDSTPQGAPTVNLTSAPSGTFMYFLQG
jgi:hypothetical protein